MSTNFYMMNGKHIGKRSAAGLYCWDCKRTLCVFGEKGVHESNAPEAWFEQCTKCGSKPSKRKTNVKPCSSFSWAVHPEKINRIKRVRDEYKRNYSIKEFNDVLKECPIRFYDLIGEDFV